MMSRPSPRPVQLRYRNLLLETSAEELAAGEWSASFAVFTQDRKNLVYWMPSLFRAFGTEREAELAGHSAGVEFIKQIDN
jgi:hypothetical protein